MSNNMLLLEVLLPLKPRELRDMLENNKTKLVEYVELKKYYYLSAKPRCMPIS